MLRALSCPLPPTPLFGYCSQQLSPNSSKILPFFFFLRILFLKCCEGRPGCCPSVRMSRCTLRGQPALREPPSSWRWGAVRKVRLYSVVAPPAPRPSPWWAQLLAAAVTCLGLANRWPRLSGAVPISRVLSGCQTNVLHFSSEIKEHLRVAVHPVGAGRFCVRKVWPREGRRSQASQELGLGSKWALKGSPIAVALYPHSTKPTGDTPGLLRKVQQDRN